ARPGAAHRRRTEPAGLGRYLDRHVAEARVRRAVADTHQLERLTLRAREEAVQLPVVRDAVAAAPERGRKGLERDAAHVALELPVLDDARGLRREVEVLPLVVERIRRRRLEQQAVVDAREELGIGLRARVER